MTRKGGISNRILTLDDQGVTFRYKDRKQRRPRTCTVSGTEFIRRFLQHVLPQGFHKVRYFGLWNPQKRCVVQRVRLMFAPEPLPAHSEPAPAKANPVKVGQGAPCPCCNTGVLILVRCLPRPPAQAP
ncbi:MAG: transposase [Magnetococcales bacterium]|nr:transposase [Magnetococcales bacterium]